MCVCVEVPRLPSSGLLEIQRLLTGNPCVSAPAPCLNRCVDVEPAFVLHLFGFCLRFQDRSLATWHLDTGTLLGWWPSSRCCSLSKVSIWHLSWFHHVDPCLSYLVLLCRGLSIPSGTAAIAWPGIAAADDGHAYVALPGPVHRSHRQHRQGSTIQSLEL